jgi:ADP-heptose:LPS heptosyltransferase
MKPKHIILSRTDSIGDVMLTLPLAGMLKQSFPNIRISFLGMPYTRDIVRSCAHVDEFIDWQELKTLPFVDAAGQLKELGADLIIHVFPNKQISRLAVKAGIPNRLGSTGRWYHWLDCNILVPLSRKNSEYHEAILNIKLAAPVLKKAYTDNDQFRLPTPYEIPALYGIKAPTLSDHSIAGFMDPDFINVILHPRSKGSAREWGLSN